MNQTFEEFLAGQTENISMTGFVLNISIAILLSYLLMFIYNRYASSLSNKFVFSQNFTPLTVTTLIIITIVKSSLALSLGLVGALSIVRFRSAIKEPQELLFLFMCIAIGLGLGASQRGITIAGFLFLVGIIFLGKKIADSKKESITPSLYLNISSDYKKIDIEDILKIVSENSEDLKMIRFDDSSETFDILLFSKFSNFEQLNNCRLNLKKLGDINISYIEKTD